MLADLRRASMHKVLDLRSRFMKFSRRLLGGERERERERERREREREREKRRERERWGRGRRE